MKQKMAQMVRVVFGATAIGPVMFQIHRPNVPVIPVKRA